MMRTPTAGSLLLFGALWLAGCGDPEALEWYDQYESFTSAMCADPGPAGIELSCHLINSNSASCEGPVPVYADWDECWDAVDRCLDTRKCPEELDLPPGVPLIDYRVTQ